MGASRFHLAQLNIARMRAPLDDPVMDGFRSQLDRINAVADRSPGFVWRLQTPEGYTTGIRAYDDERILLNLSVWESAEALHNYAYRSDHAAALRRRREWFEPPSGPHLVLWWVPAGHVPTIEEAVERLGMLGERGPTREAFTFRQLFQPPGATGPAVAALATLAALLLATVADPAPPALERELLGLENEMMNAFSRKDSTTLQRALDDSFVLTSATSRGDLIRKTGYIRGGLREIEVESFRLHDVDVRSFGNTAIVNCRLDWKSTWNGKDWSSDFLITDVWVRKPGGWRIATRHSSEPAETAPSAPMTSVSPGPPGSPPPTPRDDAAHIRALCEGYRTAWLSNDSAAVLALFSEDATLLPHHGDPAVVGKPAIRAFWRPPNSRPSRITEFTSTSDGASASGDLGFAWGRFQLSFEYEKGEVKRSTLHRGTYFMIARRQPHGGWLITHRMWDDPAAPQQ